MSIADVYSWADLKNHYLNFLFVSFLQVFYLSPVQSASDLGARTYNEFLEKDLIYPDEDWQNYIAEVGERLLLAGGLSKSDYVFYVPDLSMVNAAATPDGYVFATRGILALMSSEDELAGVIGHEIGHVVHEHGKEKKSRAVIGELIGFLAGTATGTSATRSMVNVINQSQIGRYGREAELEADEYGLRLSTLAGYDPWAVASMLEKLSDYEEYQKAHSSVPSYRGIFASHPATAKRLNDLLTDSERLQVIDLKPPERDFQAMLNGLRYGDEVSSGVVKDGRYYHGQLRLVVEFPEGWDLRASASEINARSRAVNETANIALKRMASSSEATTPEQYLRGVLKRDDLVQGEEIQVGRFSAFVATVKGSGEAGLSKISVLFKDGGVYLFSGEYKVGPNQENFEELFYRTIASFRSMTVEDMRLISTQRIKVVMANPGDTYSKIATYTPIGVGGEEILRLLNGHYPNGEPRAGDLVKVVE